MPAGAGPCRGVEEPWVLHARSVARSDPQLGRNAQQSASRGGRAPRGRPTVRSHRSCPRNQRAGVARRRVHVAGSGHRRRRRLTDVAGGRPCAPRPRRRSQFAAPSQAHADDRRGRATLRARRSWARSGDRARRREPPAVSEEPVQDVLLGQNLAATAGELPVGSPPGPSDASLHGDAVRAPVPVRRGRTGYSRRDVMIREVESRRQILRASCAVGVVAIAAIAALLFVALRPRTLEGHRVQASPPSQGPASPIGEGARPAGTKAMRLFGPNSFWNRRLGDEPIDASSAALVQELAQEVQRETQSRIGPWIATNISSTPLYRVGRDQRSVRVRLDAQGTPGEAALQKAFAAVPIPGDARPAAGQDRHMTIWQPSTDRLWEFWQARRASDGWHARWGGAIRRVSAESRLLHRVRMAGSTTQLGRDRDQPASHRRHDDRRRPPAREHQARHRRRTARAAQPGPSRGLPSAPMAQEAPPRSRREHVCSSTRSSTSTAWTCPGWRG